MSADSQSTAARLAEIAATAPDRPAVRDCGLTVTFGQFHDDLRRIVGAVAAPGLQPGSVVAVAWDGLYRHWLLTLAFESLGITTFSFAGDALPETVPVKAVIRPDNEWWESALNGPMSDLPVARLSGFAPRLVISSGTTGSPKLMAPTVPQERFRQQATGRIYGYDRDSRFLVGVGFAVQADHRRATVCLRAGGLCLYEGDGVIEDAISTARPTHVVLMPLHLLGLEKKIPALRQTGPLNVSAIGGPVPAAARAWLTAELGYTLTESYGTNETGPIACVGPDGWAAPLPGVRIHIVGEYGGVLPPGAQGTVEVASPGTVDGYLNDPAMTAARFREGWFRPGDVGTLDAAGRLRLIGRADDVLNVGGFKLNAVALDQRLVSHPLIDDAAAGVFEDASGMSALALYLVVGTEASDEELEAAVLPALPGTGFGTVRIVRTAMIPRTETGKVRRNDLHALMGHDRNS